MKIEQIEGWYILRGEIVGTSRNINDSNPLRRPRHCAMCVEHGAWLLARARERGTARVLALCDKHYTPNIGDWLQWITARAELEGLAQ